MKKRKPLTDKKGEVRELTDEYNRAVRLNLKRTFCALYFPFP